MDNEIMRRLEKIEQRQIRAEERSEAHSARVGDLLEQVVAGLNKLASSTQAPAAAAAPPPMNQQELIRWLAAAVVLASLGSKVLELIPMLWGKG